MNNITMTDFYTKVGIRLVAYAFLTLPLVAFHEAGHFLVGLLCGLEPQSVHIGWASGHVEFVYTQLELQPSLNLFLMGIAGGAFELVLLSIFVWGRDRWCIPFTIPSIVYGIGEGLTWYHFGNWTMFDYLMASRGMFTILGGVLMVLTLTGIPLKIYGRQWLAEDMARVDEELRQEEEARLALKIEQIKKNLEEALASS